MSVFLPSTQFVVTNILGMILSNAILWWGIFCFVPTALNDFGCDYFDWRRFRRQGIVGGMTLMLLSNSLISVIMKSPTHPPTFWAQPSLALVLVSLWGIWRVDRQFKLIPDRFHISGFIGAAGLAGGHLYVSQQTFGLQLLAIGSGMLLPASILGLNRIYSRYRSTEGLGLGDIKVFTWLPLALGDRVWIAFALACFIAAIIETVTLLLRKKADLRSPFAFGPYIAVSSIAALLTLS